MYRPRITFYVHSKPDSHGRQHFTAEWKSDRGRRGQCFNAVLKTVKKSGDRAVNMPSSAVCLSHAEIVRRLRDR